MGSSLYTMAETPKICSLCDQKNVTKASVQWCPECEQSFCSDCLSYHGMLNISRQHVPIPIENHLELSQAIVLPEGRCEVHKVQFQLYCQFHDTFLCPQCIDDHSECKDVTSVVKLAKGIKDSENLRDIKKRLGDSEYNVDEIDKCLTENMTDSKDHTQKQIDNINTMKNDLVEKIVELAENLTKEVMIISEDMNNSFSEAAKLLEERKNKIRTVKRELTALLEFGADLQILFGLRGISNKIDEIEKDVNCCVTGNELCKRTVSFKANEDVTYLKNVTCFGTITTENRLSKINLRASKDRQAQIGAPIENIKLQLVKSIDTCGVDVTGCTVTPDKKLIFSDYVKKGIIVIGEDGTLLFRLSLGLKQPIDVESVDAIILAASCDMEVYLVDIVKRSVLRTISIGSECFGLCFTNGILFCSASDEGVCTVDLNKIELSPSKSINIHVQMSKWSYLARSSSEGFVFTDYIKSLVRSCDRTGNILWCFEDNSILKKTWGITVDRGGNIFVCCRSLSHLIVLSKDGKDSKVLLTSNDGLSEPTSVHFDKTSNRLLVANKSSKAFLFDVS